MSGLPLANGPNATGTSSGDYGNNSVSDSRAEGNGRYGIEVVRNTLADASVHGIALVGDVEGSTLQQNTVSGRGPSALDVQRADGVDRREFDNDLGGWSDTTPWLVTLKRVLQPLNLLWATIAVIVIVTALRGARRRTGVVHPHADSRSLITAADVVVPAPAGSR